MPLHPFVRFEMLIGEKACLKLKEKKVIVFGVGGVGGFAVEALARSGVGQIDIVDNDRVALTNLNRQIIATHQTIDKPKVDVMKERIHAINPDCIVNTFQTFYLPENNDEFHFEQYDYIVDAIDTMCAKLDLIEEANTKNIPIISAMGCGNRLDPSQLCLCDLYETKGDPLAKIMRHECRKRGIRSLQVVYSKEKPIVPKMEGTNGEAMQQEKQNSGRRALPGSSPFVPSSAGLLMASKIVIDFIGEENATDQ